MRSLLPHHLLFEFDISKLLLLPVVLNFFTLVLYWAHNGQNNRQEEHTIEDTEDNDEEIHSEIVKLENCTWSESQYNNTNELGSCNSYQNGASHFRKSMECTFFSGSTLSHEVHAQMVAEFDTKTE